jgi:hypothetical protein
MKGMLGDIIAVSFVGPSSGNLILKLKHRAHRPDITLTALGTSFTLPIPESIAIDEINLHPDGDSASLLSFMPNTRNNLIFQASSAWSSYDYTLQDLQLLDEHRNLYGQPPQRDIPATELDALRAPDNRESS